MSDQPILVLGATGQQGGAVARELLRRGRSVRALVRDPRSTPAENLAELGAELARGDLDDADSLRAAMHGAAGVFSVQTFQGPDGLDGEIRQGKAVGDVAARSGVEHLVYSSVDGAERRSGVPHFESKWQVEQHLTALEVPLTVLRPTLFLDNFATNMAPQLEQGELVVRLALPPTVPLQMVATSDIGRFAADAFDDPAASIGTAMALAGEELTGPQIAAAFATRRGVPARFEELPVEAVLAFSEDLGLMFRWFAEHGYEADLPALRRRHPDLVTLDDWLSQNPNQNQPA